jgi:hypothetical protein
MVSDSDRPQPGRKVHQRPRTRRHSNRSSCAGRTTGLPSIVPGHLIQPVNDPDTGLDIFPRLPEEDEDPCAVFEGTEPNSPMDADMSSQQRPRTLSGRLFSVTGLFRKNSAASSRRGSRRSSMSSNHSHTSCVDNAEPESAAGSRAQPTERKVRRSGAHVYCKHTWDGGCRCQIILTLNQGDYCATCWAGLCLGQEVPYDEYPVASTRPDSGENPS